MTLLEVLLLHLALSHYVQGVTVERTSPSLIVLDGMYQQDRILEKESIWYQKKKSFHFSMQKRIRNIKTLPSITEQPKLRFLQELRFSPA